AALPSTPTLPMFWLAHGLGTQLALTPAAGPVAGVGRPSGLLNVATRTFASGTRTGVPASWVTVMTPLASMVESPEYVLPSRVRTVSARTQVTLEHATRSANWKIDL